MYIPFATYDHWKLLVGDDGEYFSNPTRVSFVGELVTGQGACVARCAVLCGVMTADGIGALHCVQCGVVARLAPDGAFLCDIHMAMWHCRWCAAVLGSPDAIWCSAVCRAHEVEYQREQGMFLLPDSSYRQYGPAVED